MNAPRRPLLALAASLMFPACVMPGQKPVSGESLAVTSCGESGLIDDMEDNNNQGAVVEGRGGYWYTYKDPDGTTVDPPAGSEGGVFTQSEPGANGSQFAARVHGRLSGAAINYGAMGLNFLDPKDGYDASRYQGVAFWAKKGPGGISRVRVKFPDVNTDADGEVCSECFNDFGADITLTESWQRYVVLFSKMRQEEGWGAPRPRRIDKSQLYAIQFQARGAGQAYDIWVDDIEFVGCGDE